MLSNMGPIEELISLARSKSRTYETMTVASNRKAEFISAGWNIERESATSIRFSRPKAQGHSFEDRVWTLLYKMQFNVMSSDGGAFLGLEPKSTDGPQTQIDVVAIDDEIALGIECKSAATFAKRPQFASELGKHSLIRDRFTAAVKSQYPITHKRPTVLALFYDNVNLTDNDLARAKTENIVIFRERELTYFETLVSHLGPAAKYQFLADMIPGKVIPGLEIRIPAVKSKMGKFNCYTFSISPEYLLKISYVSHRAKGRESDVDTYQRMLKKGRLVKIKEYITEDGIFPTNIVVNFEKNRLKFERSSQEADDLQNGVLGWLDIRAAYKSAWIIDGQHRLFAYSGHPMSAKSRLSILAFEGLVPSEQVKLFIDINAKQKSVKQSLLQELYAELHWDAEEPSVRLRAIISKAVQVLDASPGSALFERIQTADAPKTVRRCISLNSVYGAIEKGGFHILKEKHGQIIEFGPLWAVTNDATLRRTVLVIERWLDTIRSFTPDWWDKGMGDGGGLAMNDGIATCLNVLKSVFSHLESKHLVKLDDDDLCSLVEPYGLALGKYLGSLSEQQRKAFRDLRGVQGQTRRTRNCQRAIRESIPAFNPDGLDRFIEEESAQTNSKGKEVVDRIELTLQKTIIAELKREFGSNESEWWTIGVPKAVRVRIAPQAEEDGYKRGAKENYLNFIDYQKIALDNWATFQSILGYGKSGNKEAKLGWLNFVNEKRNMVSHASSGVTLSFEDLAQLEDYERWLHHQTTSLSALQASKDVDLVEAD